MREEAVIFGELKWNQQGKFRLGIMKNDWLGDLREGLPEEAIRGLNLEMCKIQLKKIAISKSALGNEADKLGRLPGLQQSTTRASGLASSSIKRLN